MGSGGATSGGGGGMSLPLTLPAMSSFADDRRGVPSVSADPRMTFALAPGSASQHGLMRLTASRAQLPPATSAATGAASASRTEMGAVSPGASETSVGGAGTPALHGPLPAGKAGTGRGEMAMPVAVAQHGGESGAGASGAKPANAGGDVAAAAGLRAGRVPLQPEHMRLLLVEDTLMNQVLMSKMIKRLMPSAEVVLANNGVESLDRFKEYEFDMIFMDCQVCV